MPDKFGVCAGCGEEKVLKAKGACNACYIQFKRTGSYVRERQPRGMCTVEGCAKEAHGKGMCHMHLKRLRVSGSLADPRGDNEKLMTNQKLYAQWSSYQRKDAYPIVEEWKRDFFAFRDAVGERPSLAHRLYRLDKTTPLGPGNFVWREKYATRSNDETKVDYDRRRRSAQRELYGTTVWSSELKRKYGITLEAYMALYDAQDGCCAVCLQAERHTDVKANRKALAVDHNHATAAVRGLLCMDCNTGLGKFRDDPDLLHKAIAYLEKHR